MPKTKSGISQVGGKFRLCNTILGYIPYHEFFLSMFCGACWVELNKPRSRYECYNDLDAEIINYLVMVRQYPDEFDQMKQGVYGLVSQEICNRIVRGELKPRNDLERAYFFYYLNKLTFGGDVKKVGDKYTASKSDKPEYAGIVSPAQGNRCFNQEKIEQIKGEMDKNVHAHHYGIMRPTDPIRKPQYENLKNEYDANYRGIREMHTRINIDKAKDEYQTKGFGGMINPRAGLATLHKEDIDKIKEEWKTKGYHGLIDQKLQNARIDGPGVEEAKATYQGIVPKQGIKKTKASFAGIWTDNSPRTNEVEKIKASFAGINNTRAGNNASNMRDMDKWKKEFKDTVEEGKKKSVNYSLFNAGTGSRGGMGHKGTIKQGKKEYKEKQKAGFKGLQPDGMQVRKTNVKSAKVNYAGIFPRAMGSRDGTLPKDTVEKSKASFKGIANHGATGWGTLESGEVEKAKEQYQAVSYKGINPKTTRPYHNNDCGLLTPLDRKAIERLRYVNLTCYEFTKVYKLFYNAFHVRKGLSRECFIYADPPYPGTEKYFGDKFTSDYHQTLIDFMLKTPFNFMLSIGGKCEMYLEQLSDWVIVPLKVRYSTDATSQKLSQEYIIMNYKINHIGNMKQDNQKSIMGFFK